MMLLMQETTTLQCHGAPVIKMEPGHEGRVLLTSAWGVTQETTVWKCDDGLKVM